MHEAVREQARHVADRSDRLTGKQYMAASAITGRRQISTTVRRHLARLVGCGSRRTHSPFAATTVWAGTACSCVCSASGQQPRDGRPRTLGRDSGRCDGSGSSCCLAQFAPPSRSRRLMLQGATGGLTGRSTIPSTPRTDQPRCGTSTSLVKALYSPAVRPSPPCCVPSNRLARCLPRLV